MKLDHPCDVRFRHSALSSGTSDMPMAKGGKEHRSNITAQRYRDRAFLHGVGAIRSDPSLVPSFTRVPNRTCGQSENLPPKHLALLMHRVNQGAKLS